MTSTVFQSGTVIDSVWLNDVDALVYQGQLDDGTTGSSISRYLPAGTGAVPTTVQAKLRESVSVKGFGAVGDGVTDDTAEIQNAINHCSDAFTLDFGPYTYVTDNLTIPDGISWVGDKTILKYVSTNAANVNWIRPVGTQQSGAIKGITFDYNSNASGYHIIGLSDNAHDWEITNCTFLNMKTRNAIRADYPNIVAGDGNILIKDCLFSGGDSAACVSIYASNPNAGISNIHITDCVITDCGSSLIAITMTSTAYDLTTGRWGAFTGTKIHNVSMYPNGTGAFGSIPLELWGHDQVVVSGCTVDGGTRGLGMAFGRDVVFTGNTISNQTSYAHEIVSCERLLISSEVVYNCATFVNDTSNIAADTGIGSSDIVITGNNVSGTGLASYTAGRYAIGFSSAGTNPRTRVSITNNTFSGMKYMTGVIRCDRSTNVQIAGNTYIGTSDLDTFVFTSMFGNNASIIGNTVIHEGNYTALSMLYNNKPAVIGIATTMGDLLIQGNWINLKGTMAGLGVIGIGAYAGPQVFTNIKACGNVLQGNYGDAFYINDSSGTVKVLDNDLKEVLSGNKYTLTNVLYQNRLNIYSGTAAPVSGTFLLGDRVVNTSPAVGQPKSWACTVAGTPGTWVSEGAL